MTKNEAIEMAILSIKFQSIMTNNNLFQYADERTAENAMLRFKQAIEILEGLKDAK